MLTTHCPECRTDNSVLRAARTLSGLHVPCRECGGRYPLFPRVRDVAVACAVLLVTYLPAFWLVLRFELASHPITLAILPLIVAMPATALAVAWSQRSRAARCTERTTGLPFVAGSFCSVLVMIGLLVTGAFLVLMGDVARLRPASVVQAAEISAIDLTAAENQWSCRTLEGAPLPITDLKDQVVFLNVWATWCGPCIAEMPSIERLSRSLRNEAVRFVIACREDPATVRAFLKKRPFDLPFHVLDGRLPEPFSTEYIPATFILDRRGRIVFEHVGAVDWDTDETREFLRGLLQTD